MNSGPDLPGATRLRAEEDALETFRRQLADGLPRLLGSAIGGYRRYTCDRPPDDAKGFIAYQTGCRAALAHVHLLVKLAQWAREGGDDLSQAMADEQIDLLLREAETALRGEPLGED